jgi:putative spermidine/putrescine transport system substrate-binding protein
MELSMETTRRNVLRLAAASAMASAGLPRGARAQAAQVYAVTYPGSVDEAYKAVVGPELKTRGGTAAVFTPMLNIELVSRLQAAKANPPFDVALFDDGPLITAIRNELLDKFPVGKSRAVGELPKPLQHPDGYGPAVAVTAIGIAYNPKKVPNPPTSWDDFFKPEFKGRIGLVGPASTLGTTFLVELAKLRGGSETDVEPGFAALKQLLPAVGAIAPSPGALTTLLQQGQVDLAPNFFNNVAALRAKGADIAFAKPRSGLPLQRVSVQLVRNAKNPAAALQLAELLLDPAVQARLEAAPWVQLPTNPKVALTGENLGLAASVGDLLANGKFLDWSRFVDLRGGWIERFNRDIRV